MHRCAIEKWAPALTMAELRVRLSSLFADAEVAYTDKLVHMTFSFSTLSTDIEMFRKYVGHSSFASSKDHNNLLYSLPRNKLNAASHNILLTAAAQHQLQLLESASFDHFICMAIKIAQRMQLACAKPTKRAIPNSDGNGAGPPKPKKSKSDRGKKGKPAKSGKDHWFRVAERAEELMASKADRKAFFTGHDRCKRCGFLKASDPCAGIEP